MKDPQGYDSNPQSFSGSETGASRDSRESSHRHKQRSIAGNSANPSGQGSTPRPAKIKAASLFSHLTGQASKAHRQHDRTTDDHSLLSQSESGSEAGSSISSGRSGSLSSELGTGSESDGPGTGHSKGGHPTQTRQNGQQKEPGGPSLHAQHARNQSEVRSTRSKSGVKSLFQGKRAEGVAEGLRREPRPRKARNGKIGCSGKTHDVQENTERSLGTEWNVAREQSTAGTSAGHAGPAAGMSRRTGTGAGDDVAGALNVVVIDRSKQVNTAGMEM